MFNSSRHALQQEMSLTLKVSVCVVTYNQAKYIGPCLESLVTQAPGFPYEIIVGDDCSTDGTRNIVALYAERYPQLVRPLFHHRNIGPFDNYRATHQVASGEYVAHVDGDDAALPGKLALQAKILDDHPDAAGVFHQLEMVDEAGTPLGRCWPEQAPQLFDLEYLLLNHPIVGHSSLMYRRGLIDNILLSNRRFIDFRIYEELAKAGNLRFIPSRLGRYTANVGISKANSWLAEIMSTIEDAEKHGVGLDVIRHAKSKHLFRAALNSYYQNDHAAFETLITQSIAFGTTSRAQRFFYMLRNFPVAIRFADCIYKTLRKARIARDLKMRFS